MPWHLSFVGLRWHASRCLPGPSMPKCFTKGGTEEDKANQRKRKPRGNPINIGDWAGKMVKEKKESGRRIVHKHWVKGQHSRQGKGAPATNSL